MDVVFQSYKEIDPDGTPVGIADSDTATILMLKSLAAPFQKNPNTGRA